MAPSALNPLARHSQPGFFFPHSANGPAVRRGRRIAMLPVCVVDAGGRNFESFLLFGCAGARQPFVWDAARPRLWGPATALWLRSRFVQSGVWTLPSCSCSCPHRPPPHPSNHRHHFPIGNFCSSFVVDLEINKILHPTQTGASGVK